MDDLGHLRRGGRISGATALLGTLLGIKPILHVDDEGHLIPMGKVRGRRAAIAALVEHMAETGIDLEQQEIFISHGDCLAMPRSWPTRFRRGSRFKTSTLISSVRSSVPTPARERWRCSFWVPPADSIKFGKLWHPNDRIQGFSQEISENSLYFPIFL